MRSRMTAILALYLLQSVGAAYAVDLPALGWSNHPYFSEATQAGSDSPFHREFYPAGENPGTWTERVLVDAVDFSPDSTPQSLLDAYSKQIKAHCNQFSENRLPLDPNFAASSALMMWHCGADTTTGRGTVGIIRSMLGKNHAYTVVASGNYEPFEEGKTPLLKIQLDRWVEFQRTFAFCDVLTIPGCAPDPQTIMDAPAAALTAEESEQVRLAEARGIALFHNDQLAWHATDYVMARNLLHREKGGSFMAIARPDGSGVVYFVQKRKALRVDLDENARPIKSGWEKKVPDSVSTRLVALKTASKESSRVCGDTINNVVLATEDGKGWLVYLLGATTQPDVAIIGRHLRIQTDSSGKHVESNDSSTMQCLAINNRSADAVAASGSKWMGSIVSHLVSQVPWETHVFQSLTWSMPIFVITHHAVWHVQGGRIVKIQL